VLGMETVQDILNYILWDRRLVLLPDGNALVILNPTLEDKNRATLEKQIVMRQASIMELPSEDIIFKNAREGGEWTEEDDLIIKEAENHIKFLESEKARHKSAARKSGLDKQIEETKNKLALAMEKKQNLSTLSAEYMGNEAQVFALIKATVRKMDGLPLFDENNGVAKLKESDGGLIATLIREVMTEGVLPHSEIRKAARSIEWRMVWTLNRENLAALFGTLPANLSFNQRMLVYWSRVYDMAYESTEKPDDDIIQDDEKFDTWLKNRNEDKTDSEKLKKTGGTDHHEKGVILDGYYVDECTCGVADIKVKGHGERPRHANTCFYGTYRKYTREEKNKIADGIYARNSRRIQMLQTQEQMKVAEVGLIDEKDLRTKKSRMLLGSNQEVHRINR